MVSEPFDGAWLDDQLAGRRFSHVSVVKETGSTNADLRTAAREGAHDGAVLLAEHQTAGRGRAGRTWESRPGRSVLCSVLVRPGPDPELAGLLPLAAGLAAAEACEAAAPGLGVTLKWPNDLLVDGRKLGGILVEAETEGSRLSFAVVGVGINVNQVRDELPEGATSLRLASVREVERERVVVALLVTLEERLGQVADPGVLLADYRARSATIGRVVRVDRAAGPLEGMALDVERSGALVVAGPEGPVTVSSGDVLLLRTESGGRS